MTAQSLLHLVGTIAVFAAVIPGLMFVIMYSTVRWWKTDVGRAMMALGASETLVLLLVVVAVVMGHDTIFFAWLRTLAFVPIPIIFTWRVVVLRRYQRMGRLEEMGLPANPNGRVPVLWKDQDGSTDRDDVDPPATGTGLIEGSTR